VYGFGESTIQSRLTFIEPIGIGLYRSTP